MGKQNNGASTPSTDSKRAAPVPKTPEAAARQVAARTKSRISARDFVRAFQTSNSYAEVSAKLGVTHATIAQRASLLRKRGVNLKSMAGHGGAGGHRINTDDLNSFIENLGDDSAIEPEDAGTPAETTGAAPEDEALDF